MHRIGDQRHAKRAFLGSKVGRVICAYTVLMTDRAAMLHNRITGGVFHGVLFVDNVTVCSRDARLSVE